MFGFIGIGVRAVSKIILGVLLVSNAYAANPYQMGGLDYFNSRKKLDQGLEQKEDVFDFREAAVGADGKLTYYTPPLPMLNLLQAPTPDNARAYLDWQKQKLSKIIKAQQMIDQMMQEGGSL